MTTRATQLGWGDPGAPSAANDARFRAAHIVTVRLGAAGVPVALNRDAVPLFQGLVHDLEAQGYPIRGGNPSETSGYYLRWIRHLGKSVIGSLSEHSNGTALDVNAPENPQGKPVRTNLPANINALAQKWGLVWGGNFSLPDPMHFQVNVRPDQVAGIVARNSGGSTPPTPVLPAPAVQPKVSSTSSSPASSSPAKSKGSAFSGVFGGVWKIVVEASLVVGAVALIAVGVDRGVRAPTAERPVGLDRIKTAAERGAI